MISAITIAALLAVAGVLGLLHAKLSFILAPVLVAAVEVLAVLGRRRRWRVIEGAAELRMLRIAAAAGFALLLVVLAVLTLLVTIGP